MKTNRFVALLMALALILSLASLAQADEKPATWLSDELVEIRVMRGENALQPILQDNIKLQTIEELLNVRLIVEVAPDANYDDKKSTLIATDDMPDLMLVDLEDVRKYARDDMFVNLTEHRDEMPNLFALIDANSSLKTLNVDGSLYGAPVLQRMNPDARLSGQLVNFRVDLLEKYGLAVPTTFDELYDVMLAIHEKEPELIGLTDRKGTRKLLDCVAYPLGSGSSTYYDEDLGGQWIYGPAHENFKAVLSYLNKLYAAGLLDADYSTNTKDQWAEKLSSGKAMCTIENDGVVRNYNAALKTVDPSYNISVIPTLTNSFGQTRNFTYDINWTNQNWVIATSSDKQEVCIKFLDWCYSDEGANVNGYGKLGETYDIVDGNPVVKAELLDKYVVNGANAAYDIQSALGVGLNDITPYVDTGLQNQMEIRMLGSEEAVAEYRELIASIAADDGLRSPVLTPSLSAEQTERYNELLVKVENLVWQEVDKYITGEEPIENYDKVIEAARAAGATEMEEIYNAAWNAALGE